MPLATADLVGDVVDARPAVAVLGEVAHRDLDDPLATRFGVGGALDAGGPHGAATVAEIEEPEGPPARREPKLSATVSPSGSVAPSNLRFRRADLRTPQDRLAALPTVRRRGLRLAASSGGGAPVRLPLAGSSATWAAVPALRPSRPTRCGLAAFPESGTPVPPCGFPVAPSGSFASVASTAWSEAKCIGRPDRGQPDVSAGQSVYLQVRGSNERVTNRRTNRERQRSCCSRAMRAASKFSRVTDMRTRSTQRPSFQERSASRASSRKPECA